MSDRGWNTNNTLRRRLPRPAIPSQSRFHACVLVFHSWMIPAQKRLPAWLVGQAYDVSIGSARRGKLIAEALSKFHCLARVTFTGRGVLKFDKLPGRPALLGDLDILGVLDRLP